MGARSWCDRRSQPTPQHHQQHQGQHQQEELANYHHRHRGGSHPVTPSPGPPPEYPPKEPLSAVNNATYQPLPEKQSKPILRTNSPTLPLETLAMYTSSTVKERQRVETGLLRDRQVRLNSVQTDILLDLPPAIALPDGEEHRAHTCKLRDAGGGGYESVHFIRLRDPEQESEIYRGYIRPPPNRTVLERGPCENVPYPQPPPPPYGSSGSLSGGGAYHKPSRFGFSLRTSSSEDSDTVSLVSRSNSLGSSMSCPMPKVSSQRSPPEDPSVGARLRNSLTPQNRSLSEGLTLMTSSRDREALLPETTDETYEEYSDSPPSYSDIVGFDTTPLVSCPRQQSNGV